MKNRMILATVLAMAFMFSSACVPPPGPSIKRHQRIMFPPPPPLLFPAPPMLTFWPAYGVYVSVNVSDDVVFFQGRWYRMHGGNWYRAGGHNGPWKNVPPGQLPKSLRGLPGNPKGHLKGLPRVRHDDMERNWRKWGTKGPGIEQQKKEERKYKKDRGKKSKKNRNGYDEENKNNRGKKGKKKR